MKKVIKFVLTIMSLVIFTGCNNSDESKDSLTKSYSVDEVKNISITSDVNDIVISTKDTSEITVSIDGVDDNICNLLDNTLTITIPEADNGINFKNAGKLYLYVPSDFYCDSITVDSTNGNISIDNAKVSNFNVTTQYGNIKTKNIIGSVEAKAEMGEITTSHSADDTDSSPNIFKGVIGNDSSETYSSTLISKVGDIVLE